MYSKVIGTFFVFLCMTSSMSAQDCTLDIGGKNTETIVSIFQLNEQQIVTMEALRAELKIEVKSIEDDIRKLFDGHPQSTSAELIVLADKYKILQQKMEDTVKAADKKLLSTFNERQYQRYLVLCDEALRNPIRIIPVVSSTNIAPE